MSAHRRLILALALLAPIAAATTIAGDASAEKKPPAVDKLANALGGQILFFDAKPPDIVAGPGTLTAKKITKKEENSDKKWVIHMMIFLKKPLDVNKLDLLIYKHDKKGVMGEMVHKLEQFPSGDGRTFYFVVPIEKYKPVGMEPNLKYTFKAVASTGPVAEGTIELTGKEEKIQGNGNLDFTNGETEKPKEEKATSPFDASVTKDNLKKVIYEDCKTSASKGGSAKIILTISPKDGKVLRAEFEKDPPPPFSDGTQKCILGRFEKMKTKPFTGEQKTIGYKVSL
jgi:hypothetical protein